LQREKKLAIENGDNEYKAALAKEQLLSEAFEKQKVLANQLNESNVQYNILRREVETSKQLYDGLLQRMKEAGVAAGLKSSNIRIVDEALVPKSPISPNVQKNLLVGLLMGLVVGLGIAFGLNYLDNTVKTPEDVEQLIGLPSLGLIPSLQSARVRYGYLSVAEQKEGSGAIRRTCEAGSGNGNVDGRQIRGCRGLPRFACIAVAFHSGESSQGHHGYIRKSKGRKDNDGLQRRIESGSDGQKSSDYGLRYA